MSSLIWENLRVSLRLQRWRSSGQSWGYPLPAGGYVNEHELRPHVREALQFLKERMGSKCLGDYLEFGVYRGNSLLLVYDELERAGLCDVRLFGFDSFEGLPSDEENYWSKGLFAADYNAVHRELIKRQVDEKRATLVKGFFNETLNHDFCEQHELQRVSLVMVDCDLYSSAREALDFCGPLLTDEAIIIFDDWNPLAKENKGEKRAFDEFLLGNPHIKATPVAEYSWKPGDLHGKIFHLTCY